MGSPLPFFMFAPALAWGMTMMAAFNIMAHMFVPPERENR